MLTPEIEPQIPNERQYPPLSTYNNIMYILEISSVKHFTYKYDWGGSAILEHF